MDAGNPGPPGAAAARRAVGDSNRDRGCVRVPCSEVKPAPESRRRRGDAARGDAQVIMLCTWTKCTSVERPAMFLHLRYTHDAILMQTLFPSSSPEPHEICPEELTGDVVWKRTPAGDMAAVTCPTEASGTLPGPLCSPPPKQQQCHT